MASIQRTSPEKFCTERSLDPVACEFDGVANMTVGSGAMGWPIRYRQLHLGKMTAWLKLQRRNDVSLQYIYSSGRIEFDGSTSEDHVTVFMAGGQKPIWINGNTSKREGVFILNPETHFHGVSPERGRMLSMQVPCSQIEQSAYKELDCLFGNIGYLEHPLTPGSKSLNRLRSLMLNAIYHPEMNRVLSDPALELAQLLATVIQRNDDASRKLTRNMSLESHRIISRAREYIERNLAEHIAMSELCDHAATSLSKLERTFRRELKITPSQYVLTRRLNRVHRELKLANGNVTRIAHVALDHGLNHHGRFSANYRNQFGELPSQTLETTI